MYVHVQTYGCKNVALNHSIDKTESKDKVNLSHYPLEGKPNFVTNVYQCVLLFFFSFGKNG